MKDPGLDRMQEVDATLRLLGSAEPRLGLEARVHARLAHAHVEQRAWWRLGKWELGGAVAVVCAVCAALAMHWEAGRAVMPPLQSATPITAPAQSGLSTAAGRATPLSGVPVHSAGRAHQRHAGPGRAAIARNAHRANGVVLPGAPVPAH